MQLENDEGVLDYILGDKEIDNYILKGVYDNLDVLPSGGKAKNPTAALNSDKFVTLLSELRDKYDKVIIDSPPLAAVSDSLNIVPLVDAVVYVIKYDAVKKTLANTCIRRLWESKTPILGAVLNNVAMGLSTYYSQYSADKKYSAYYMQESYLGNTGESQMDNDEVTLADADIDAGPDEKQDV